MSGISCVERRNADSSIIGAVEEQAAAANWSCNDCAAGRSWVGGWGAELGDVIGAQKKLSYIDISFNPFFPMCGSVCV